LAAIEKDSSYINPLNRSLGIFFKDAFRITMKSPSQAYHFLRTVRWQQKASKVRASWKQQGIHVPPIVIFSITNRCNLHCKGCYAQALHQLSSAEMSEDKLRSTIAEAHELGISFLVIGGGEPLVRQEILDIASEFRDMIFLIFTNGLLINEQVLATLKRQKNIVPIVSLEGYEADTDERRGKGVYERLQRVMERLSSKSIFFGVSLTLTRSNFADITSTQFIKRLTGLGCKLFFLVDYTPVSEETKAWELTEEQKDSVMGIVKSLRKKFAALFISVPGDEEEFGGCLAAGRGFIHISAEGDLEPCPFAPYSDASLRDKPLKEALKSEFLKAIRDNQEQLSEGQSGCALWEKRDWVRSLLKTNTKSQK
jgi:MoaA/NifB/PqqE/SkfB family radical SAM enzyme